MINTPNIRVLWSIVLSFQEHNRMCLQKVSRGGLEDLVTRAWDVGAQRSRDDSGQIRSSRH